MCHTTDPLLGLFFQTSTFCTRNFRDWSDDVYNFSAKYTDAIYWYQKWYQIDNHLTALNIPANSCECRNAPTVTLPSKLCGGQWRRGQTPRRRPFDFLFFVFRNINFSQLHFEISVFSHIHIKFISTSYHKLYELNF